MLRESSKHAILLILDLKHDLQFVEDATNFAEQFAFADDVKKDFVHGCCFDFVLGAEDAGGMGDV